MPSIPLHPPLSPPTSTSTPRSPLPPLLHTPHGLAILEIQGTLHTPSPSSTNDPSSTPIGRLIFPNYDPNIKDDGSGKWMKQVYLYVGQHQRLTGEVKKLGKAIAVVRQRETKAGNGGGMGMDSDGMDGEGEELEIVDIVEYKILFQGRPEPVGD